MLSGKATNTYLIVFGLTQPGLEPMIYHTRGEHANHYTTDAVHLLVKHVSYHELDIDICPLLEGDRIINIPSYTNSLKQSFFIHFNIS